MVLRGMPGSERGTKREGYMHKALGTVHAKAQHQHLSGTVVACQRT